MCKEEILTNPKSISIDLQAFVESGLLQIVATCASIGSPETHLRFIAQKHDAACIVIDPMSALTRFVNTRPSPGLTQRLIDWPKDDRRTLIRTGLLGDSGDLIEPPPLQIPTIADTWIHLNDAEHGEERRRDLAVIKSRGTSHSRQMCAFMLSDAAINLLSRRKGEAASEEVLSVGLDFQQDHCLPPQSTEKDNGI